MEKIEYFPDFLKPIFDHSNLGEYEWLLKYKELYFKVIVQPEGLPEIPNCELFKISPSAEMFYSLYYDTLKTFQHKWDYYECTLTIFKTKDSNLSETYRQQISKK